MAKFRYTALEPDTQSRLVGALEAPDADSALRFLLAKGYTVERLRRVNDAHIVLAGPTRHDSFAIEHRPGPYQASVMDLWHKHHLGDQAFRRLLLIGSLLGILLVVFGGQDSSTSAVASSKGESEKQVVLKGKLVGSDGRAPDPESLKVTLSLPQLPLSRTWKSSEVLNEDGLLHGGLEFQTHRPAGHGEVLIEKPGYRSLHLKHAALTFSGTKATIDLGRQVLEPL